jgi:hypothetical protein
MKFGFQLMPGVSHQKIADQHFSLHLLAQRAAVANDQLESLAEVPIDVGRH